MRILRGLLLLAALLPHGSEAQFYFRGEEGWFWYAEPPPEPEPEPPLEPEPAPAVSATPPAPPPPAELAQPAAPAPFSAAWYRANLPKYRDAALDHPTPANVAAYLYLQRVAMDQASRFTDVAQRVVWQDPYLDETVRRPLAEYAAAETSRQAAAARETLARDLAAQAGIWFFYRSDCPHCHLQATVLALLEQHFGFIVTAIALDGGALPDGRYPQFARDQGQAATLGVTTTPALFLVRPPADVLPISQGALARDELLQRMLALAAQAGWISATDFERTRPVKADWRLTAPAEMTPADWANPAALVEKIRAAGGPVQPATDP